MEQFRNIGIIGRLGSSQVLDTIRRLKRFLVERHLHVILEENIAEVLPGHGMQTSSRQRLGESCDLVIVVGGDGSLLGAARAMGRTVGRAAHAVRTHAPPAPAYLGGERGTRGHAQ